MRIAVRRGARVRCRTPRVAVPVELAFDDPEADDAVVDGRERLVEPGLVGGDLGRDVDQLEAAVLVVEMDVVVHRSHDGECRGRRPAGQRSAERRTLPVGVRGSSAAKSTMRGYL